MNKNEEFSDFLAKYNKIGMEDFDDLLSGTSLDKPAARPHDKSMNSVTREELDAKLETIEVKMDGKLSRIQDQLGVIAEGIKGQKSSTWQATAVVVGTIVAAAALGVSMFDAGRDTSKVASDAQAEINRVNAETAKTLSEIQQIAAELKASKAEQTKPSSAPK